MQFLRQRIEYLESEIQSELSEKKATRNYARIRSNRAIIRRLNSWIHAEAVAQANRMMWQMKEQLNGK